MLAKTAPIFNIVHSTPQAEKVAVSNESLTTVKTYKHHAHIYLSNSLHKQSIKICLYVRLSKSSFFIDTFYCTHKATNL